MPPARPSHPLRPRRATRHFVREMSCLGGEVIDLSSTGLRILTNRKPAVQPGEIRRLAFGTEQQTLSLDARIVWIRRKSLLSRQWTLGAQFVDGRAAVKTLVDRFARFGYLDRQAALTPDDGPPDAANDNNPVGSGSDAAGNNHPSAGEPTAVQIAPPDLYAILGLDASADDNAIRIAYRTLARELHPDSGTEGGDPERFELVQKAYRVLRDPAIRERYKAQLLKYAA